MSTYEGFDGMLSESRLESKKKWIGHSIDVLHSEKSPWNYEIPLVLPSKHHAVLYQDAADLTNVPKSRKSVNLVHWSSDFVRMPYSPKNLFPVKQPNGDEILVERWTLIKKALTDSQITSSEQLEAVVHSYNTKLPKFSALHFYFNEVLEEFESEAFFDKLLPGIIRLALKMPDLVSTSIPLLKRENNRTISMSQMQVACILANAFLCTFPWRRDMSTYPGVNFVRLFSAHISDGKPNPVSEKLKCICHYFRMVLQKPRTGVVTFKRKFLPRNQMPRWDKIDKTFVDLKLHITSNGTIEDNGDGMLQVDFANKYVGGGVLGFGCVQEEIRFVINPELIASRLFTENLASTESLVVTGAERFSNYSGYADTFTWNGNFEDKTPHDNSGRRRTTIVAIDAQHFTRGTNRSQFEMGSILREVNKAYIGFCTNRPGILPPVATGNWGCGAFGGDPHLKFLIQLMACSVSNRNMIYFTFGNDTLRDTLFEMYNFIVMNQISCSHLWKLLHKFSLAKSPPSEFYPFLQQAHFDSKNQLSIKSFISCYKSSNSSVGETSTSQPTISQSNSNNDNFEQSEPIQVISNKKFKVQNSPQKKIEINEEEADVIKLMNDIQGECSTKTETNFNKSLLSVVDELCVKNNSKINNNKCSLNGELMDIDEAIDLLNASENEEEKLVPTSKKKITDYFTKQNK